MSTENQISIGNHAKDNIVISGDRNLVQVTTVQIIQHSGSAKKKAPLYPYKSLHTYEFSDRDIFFGRDALIDEIVSKIPSYKTLLLSGVSGAGKSSLLRAGVIPRLLDHDYTCISFRDYTDPLLQLHTALINSGLLPQQDLTDRSLRQMLKISSQLRAHWVIVFDQFEGFFNVCLAIAVVDLLRQ
jgi:ABC-type bacteriocin/lantibiotic exporter with double-glycine peptidase domain